MPVQFLRSKLAGKRSILAITQERPFYQAKRKPLNPLLNRCNNRDEQTNRCPARHFVKQTGVPERIGPYRMSGPLNLSEARTGSVRCENWLRLSCGCSEGSSD